MIVVHATKKLLVRLGPTTPGAAKDAIGLLDSWHATALFWRPQIALFVMFHSSPGSLRQGCC